MKYLACLVLALTAACSSNSPTGSVCPTTDPPTYENFGEAFFATYCTSCHSNTSRDRHDAPKSQNYDSEADILKHADDIDAEAAAGPDATNTSMPEIEGDVRSAPTDAERKRLGEYIACLQAAE